MTAGPKAPKVKPFDASEWHVGIVVASFNSSATKKMLDIATKRLITDYKVKKDNITTISVAGSADTPAALEVLGRNDLVRCIVTLGAVVGENNPRYEVVSQMAADAVREVAIKHAKPISFGITMSETLKDAEAAVEQAIEFTDAAMQEAAEIEKAK